MPLPEEEVTSPVTKIYFAIKIACGPGGEIPRGRVKLVLYNWMRTRCDTLVEKLGITLYPTSILRLDLIKTGYNSLY